MLFGNKAPAALFVNEPTDKNTVRVKLAGTQAVTLLLAFEVWLEVTCTNTPERHQLSRISYLTLFRGGSGFPHRGSLTQHCQINMLPSSGCGTASTAAIYEAAEIRHLEYNAT